MPLHRLLPLAQQGRQAFLDLLRRLVEVESPTRDEAACDRMADLLFATLAADGWRVERDPRSGVGDLLAAALPDTGDGPATLVLAHYDTVWPIGTLSEMPWRVDDAEDRAYGPGTLDMKAGIVGTLLAARWLRELGVTPPGPVTLLITSDEEVGSAASRERIEAEARRHDRVLVVEGARDDGALKVGRKGVADYHLEFTGVPAHAGNDPDRGASALVELAHMALFVRTLDDRDAGTTAHPTVARAGGAVNVITEDARLDVDVRVLRGDEAERIDGALRGWRPRDPRVTVAVHGGLNRPPMEPTPANLALFDEARRVASSWGLELDAAVVGGGSDGNFTSALGIPTLDGLGACGAGAHARGEHVRIGDTLTRVALLAALLGGLAPA
jgi:glutamate carboxypeptidase